MYNMTVKEEFINSNGYAEKSKVLLSHTFTKLGGYEYSINKDIYEMNLSELEGALRYMECGTLHRVMNVVSNIKVYSRWAYDNNYSKKQDSEFNPILSSDYYINFVQNSNTFYLTRNELLNYLDAIPNYLIKASLLAIFEGIGGRGYQELSNIKSSDIFKDGNQWYVNLRNELDRSIRRRHPISHQLRDFLVLANDETTFKGMDGKTKYDLIESDYIFRYFISRRNVGMQKVLSGSKADAKLYETYLRYFREAFQLSKAGLKFSLKELKYSGLMHYLNTELDKQKDNHLVTTEVIDGLANRFILPTQNTGGKEYTVYSKVKVMISPSFMQEVYGKNLRFDFSRTAKLV